MKKICFLLIIMFLFLLSGCRQQDLETTKTILIDALEYNQQHDYNSNTIKITFDNNTYEYWFKIKEDTIQVYSEYNDGTSTVIVFDRENTMSITTYNIDYETNDHQEIETSYFTINEQDFLASYINYNLVNFFVDYNNVCQYHRIIENSIFDDDDGWDHTFIFLDEYEILLNNFDLDITLQNINVKLHTGSITETQYYVTGSYFVNGYYNGTLYEIEINKQGEIFYD